MSDSMINLKKGIGLIVAILSGLITFGVLLIVAYLIMGTLAGTATSGTITVMNSEFNNSLNNTIISDLVSIFEQMPDAALIVVGLISAVVVIGVFAFWIKGGGMGGNSGNKKSYF